MKKKTTSQVVTGIETAAADVIVFVKETKKYSHCAMAKAKVVVVEVIVAVVEVMAIAVVEKVEEVSMAAAMRVVVVTMLVVVVTAMEEAAAEASVVVANVKENFPEDQNRWTLVLELNPFHGFLSSLNP